MIASGIDIAGAVTNPDRPAGRGMRVVASPVKEAARAAGIELLQPARARAPEVQAWLASKEPDVAVVVAYGKILPAELLVIPALGFVNVHFSILPHYRGAAPVQRAVMAGDLTTGVSIMVLTEGMDEGPVLAVERTPIARDDTAGTVGDRLADLGAGLLVRTLPAYASGSLTPVEQDHSAATYAPKVTSEDARIDWTWPAGRVADVVRGCNPSPGAWTSLEGKRMKVFAVSTGAPDGLQPGEIAVTPVGLVAGAGDGSVVLTDVQLAGRKRMSGADLGRGLRLGPGTHLDEAGA